MDLTAALQGMINTAVDERIGQVQARGDAMARMHGEYLKVKDAAKVMNVSPSTVRRLLQEGRLDACSIGVATRSIAELVERDGGVVRSPRAPRAAKTGRTMAYERIMP